MIMNTKQVLPRHLQCAQLLALLLAARSASTRLPAKCLKQECMCQIVWKLIVEWAGNFLSGIVFTVWFLFFICFCKLLIVCDFSKCYVTNDVVVFEILFFAILCITFACFLLFMYPLCVVAQVFIWLQGFFFSENVYSDNVDAGTIWKTSISIIEKELLLAGNWFSTECWSLQRRWVIGMK